MASRSKRRGTTAEYALRDLLRALGWKADRVYASGAHKAAGREFTGDVVARFPDLEIRGESKLRSGEGGWKTLERWLADVDFLALKRPREKPLFVLPYETLRRLLEAYEEHGGEIRSRRLAGPEEEEPCPVQA